MLAACLDHLRKGDILVVLDLDRLGRRAAELVALIDDLESRGIGFKAPNSPMDTTAPAGRAFLQIQAAFAEMERNVIRHRVRPGLALQPTVHAIKEGHDQRRLDSDHVQSDIGHASDRSCHEDWCVCREVGLPEKHHPHSTNYLGEFVS